MYVRGSKTRGRLEGKGRVGRGGEEGRMGT